MGSFEDDILGRIPNIEAGAAAARAAEAENRLREQRLEQESRATFSRCMQISRDAASLLVSRRVAPNQLWVRESNNANIIRNPTAGWHVMTLQRYQGAEMPTIDDPYGLTEDGYFVWSFCPRYGTNDGSFEGFISRNPGYNDLKLLEGDSFKNGLASLISGYGPYKE